MGLEAVGGDGDVKPRALSGFNGSPEVVRELQV